MVKFNVECRSKAQNRSQRQRRREIFEKRPFWANYEVLVVLPFSKIFDHPPYLSCLVKSHMNKERGNLIWKTEFEKNQKCLIISFKGFIEDKNLN